MNRTEKMAPFEAARRFVDETFPECDAALLAGSITRGEETSTSDLDIVIFDENIPSAYRESMFAYGWPIEVFVHNYQSYRTFFENDVKRARPSLPRMVSEGVILREGRQLPLIVEEAKSILKNGPEPLSIKEIDFKRYFITDSLDDFIGSENKDEEIFIASTLAEQLHEFVLRTNNRWIGRSKWVVRELKSFDPLLAERYTKSFREYYRTGEKRAVIELAESILEPYGGRLFEGFTIK
ncbi:nucleotidyltransferase domain-containing protein [Mesobacillus subterraneus]|uniref:Nucleotidyltransferase domain-containing protein n=1 Tax=Mesobacillus subterraneus TaxID=285983 RepID=A0A427TM37_9BACI|nr:nucleotidyltransferase domain-containing protein [Mesobacillus subterraneus]RSD25408.1 nucleotidyltransferase domain-containing protein [Mesobacillus subterraneus]